MPWTEAMMDFLADGRWHLRDEVIAVGEVLVSEERALEEMGERSLVSSRERRVSAGRRTVAQQALQGRRRFGAVETRKEGKEIYVRKTGAEGVSIGHLSERVTKLTAELDSLRVLVGVLAAKIGVEDLDSLTSGDITNTVVDAVNGGE
jgi:hypothetical protein